MIQAMFILMSINLADLYIIYKSGITDDDNVKFGHSIPELAVGAIVGLVVTHILIKLNV